MGLEVATYITQLNAAFPIGAADPKSQGDDHLRLLKSVLQASFPNVGGAVTLSHTQINDAALKSANNTFTTGQTIATVNNGLTLNAGAGVSKAAYIQFTGTDAASALKTYYVGVNPFGADGALEIKPSSGLLGIRMDSAGNTTIAGVASTDYARLSQANVFNAGATPNVLVLNSTHASGAYQTFQRSGTSFGDIGNGAQMGGGFTLDAMAVAARAGNPLQFAGGGAAAPHLSISSTGVSTFSITASIASLTAPIVLNSNAPGIYWNEADGAANNKIWFQFLNGEQMRRSVMTDAFAETVYETVDRTAGAVDSIIWTAASLQLAGATNIQLTTPLLAAVGIHNGTAPTGTSERIASGTYTPTLTNTTNISASVSAVCQWTRVGSVVNVSGRITVDPVSASGTATVLGISLPIASALATNNQCGGTGSRVTTLGASHESACIDADAANDRAEMFWNCTDANNGVMTFQFQYVVV